MSRLLPGFMPRSVKRPNPTISAATVTATAKSGGSVDPTRPGGLFHALPTANPGEPEAKKVKLEEPVKQPVATLPPDDDDEEDDPFGLCAIDTSKSSAPVPPPVAEASKAVSVEGALGRIVTALGSSASSKFEKAMKLLISMVESPTLTSENSRHFFTAISAAVALDGGKRLQNPSVCRQYATLMRAIHSRRELFSLMQQGDISALYIRTVLFTKCHTDDTYEFVAVIKEVKVTMLKLLQDESEWRVKRQAAMIEVLEAAYSRFKTPWARGPVEDLINNAYINAAGLFNKEQQKALQGWQATIKARKK